MADSNTEDFDWVAASGACTTEQMFTRLLEGARKDVDRRNASGFGRTDGWRFELHNDEADTFEVSRIADSSKDGAFVEFQRVGPRINIHGEGVDVELFAVVGINAAGECRFYIGEHEYLGWEVRKLALDTLFFEREEDD